MLDFLSFTIFDALDILLVAFLFYQLFRWIRGTVAVNIFFGIAIIYLLWLIVQALNMTLISTILGQFLGVGVIALLIVFQQEIRKFLLLLGSKYNFQKILSLDPRKTSVKEDVAEAIVKSCIFFSNNKIGALIVITKKMDLFAFAQTGVLVRSLISEELLENIFFKNSPLHDGAVIIADDKLVAARCILPVDDSNKIPGSMGLRHRAALGISKETDAHVVVVSEETGNITYFRDGGYRVRISSDELKNYLLGDFSNWVSF